MLNCSSMGGPNNTYQWQINNSDLVGESSPILILFNVEASTGGIYTCRVSNVAGDDETSTFVYVSPYFVTQPVDTLSANGSSITLLCEAEAFPNPDYQWWRVDQELIRSEVLDSSQLVLDPVLFGDEGDYYCNVSSLEHTIQSHVVTVSGKVESWNCPRCILYWLQ